MLETISPTKQGSQSRGDSVYHYYAGYPSQFVETLLAELAVSPEHVILDPWNGAGTTTEVCAFRGIPSIGVDANPFMKVVAQVRSMFASELLMATMRIEVALAKAKIGDDVAAPHVVAARLLRRLEDEGTLGRDDQVAIFVFASATKRVVQSVRSKNPTWFSRRKTDAVLSSELELRESVRAELARLRSWAEGRQISALGHKPPTLLTGDVSRMWIGRRVDHILGSPPYLTRIDYVQKTLPELLFLSELYGLDIKHLRQSMLGTVLTSGTDDNLSKPKSATAVRVLKAIKAHDSKASQTYYHRFFAGYFDGLARTVRRFNSLLTFTGTVTLVTQGSYYKEQYVDLPAVVAEMMAAVGFREEARRAFKPTNHMALINSRTYASRQEAPEEVVATFRRTGSL